jgi:hypothetical protein
MWLQDFSHASPVLFLIMRSLHDVHKPIGPIGDIIYLRQTHIFQLENHSSGLDENFIRGFDFINDRQKKLVI